MAASKSRNDVQSSMRAHVLAVPYAAMMGHMNPLMSLCQHLAAEEVVITFAYSQAYYERAMQLTMGGKDDGGISGRCNNNIRVVGVRDGLPYEESMSADTARLQCQAGIDMEDHLVALAQTSSLHHPAGPITCIIADTFILCASSAARRLGIPHVAFWTQSAASFAAHVVATQNYSTIKGHAVTEADAGAAARSRLTCIPGCPPLKFQELPTFLQSCDPTEVFFAYLTKCFENMLNCPRILLNTFQELECESMEFVNKLWQNKACAVGPLLSNSENISTGALIRPKAWAAKDECMAWLDMQRSRSVLFVSFGSLALMSEGQLAELAAGLEASGCPFLMVVRESMMEGQAAKFPIGFRKKMEEDGRAFFVPWAPQLRVLGNSAIGGFLTHCGWNSSLEAISQGLPMLCWPYFADQLLNCRCIVDAWGIGVDLIEDKSKLSAAPSELLVSRHLIEEKVRYLMDPASSRTIRERANQLRMEASKDDSSSHLALMSFVSWIQKV